MTNSTLVIRPHICTQVPNPKPLIDYGVDVDWLPSPDPPQEDLATLLAEHSWDEIAPLLDLIPPQEADIVELIVLRNKAQRDLAEIFELSQPGISYAFGRGIFRLHFLARRPKYTPQEVGDLLRPILVNSSFGEDRLSIMLESWDDPSQVRIAAKHLRGQGWVRHHYMHSLILLRKYIEKHGECSQALKDIYEHFDWVYRKKAWCTMNKVPCYENRVRKNR